jgi:hypothetical protein
MLITRYKALKPSVTWLKSNNPMYFLDVCLRAYWSENVQGYIVFLCIVRTDVCILYAAFVLCIAGLSVAKHPSTLNKWRNNTSLL